MTIEEYQTLTGTTVAASDIARYEAAIARAQKTLESLLGYTLDSDKVDDNQYTELGKTTTSCPCPDYNTDDLQDADPVVFAYRLFPYHPADSFFHIDPASAIHKVKLVKDNITFRTLDEKDYRAQYKNGIIKYLERCEKWCLCREKCYCVQLAVDADWLFEDDIPSELLYIWADLVDDTTDLTKGIKSQTLGSHSYTYFDTAGSATDDESIFKVLKKYAGPNGTLKVTVVL